MKNQDEASLLTHEGPTGNIYSADEEKTVADQTSPGSESSSYVEPKQMTKCQIILLNLSFLGINLMYLLLSVEMIPAQIQALVGSAHKGSVLGGLVAGGAVVTFITGPLIGMESDRLVTRFGRRRPVMVIATIALCVGLLGLACSAPKVNMMTTNDDNITNDSGMCDRDLVEKRCAPYYTNASALRNMLSKYHHSQVILAQTNDKNDFDDGVNPVEVGHLGLYIVFYLLVTISYVCMVTPYNALIADKAHPHQRGLSSGVMGGMILAGNIGGAALGLLIPTGGVICVYLVTMLLLVICVSITVVLTPEDKCKPPLEPRSCRNVIIGFWIPLKDSDFRWVFFTRFLMQQGLTTTVGFLEYWLGDMIQLPDCWNTYKGLSLILLPMLCSAATASVSFGLISDRWGRRKPLVIGASITMSMVTAILAFLRGTYAYYFTVALSVLFGIAFGGYQAVDFALLMDVLPNANEKSRDIAVWQQALVLPQAIAVPIGGVIIDLFERADCELGLGYIIMFIITSVYFLLSGVFVTRIQRSQ